MGNLFDLEYLYLRSNELTGTLPPELGSFQRLRHCLLSFNQFSGTVPYSFSMWTNVGKSEYPQDIFSYSDLIRFCLCFFKEAVGLCEINLSGDLDAIFCNTTLLGIHHLAADCGGGDPEVTCSCCTQCCTNDDSPCDTYSQQVCKNYAADWEVNKFQGTANCTCSDDNLSFSCTFGDCETCNEDSTVCGVATGYEFLFDADGFYLSSRSSFQYTRGRPNSVVSWERFEDNACEVYVDGTECQLCLLRTTCADGFSGIHVVCGNRLNDLVGPNEYMSCFPQEGLVLDVFAWMDRESWTECPLISLQEVFF